MSEQPSTRPTVLALVADAFCDPETGVCALPTPPATAAPAVDGEGIIASPNEHESASAHGGDH